MDPVARRLDDDKMLTLNVDANTNCYHFLLRVIVPVPVPVPVFSTLFLPPLLVIRLFVRRCAITIPPLPPSSLTRSGAYQQQLAGQGYKAMPHVLDSGLELWELQCSVLL